MMDEEVIMVETVSHKETMFTDRQRKNAALARQAQMRMGYPSVRDIVDGINRGRVLNLPITKNDLDNAERIWGKDMGSIVGKTTRRRPSPVVIEPTHKCRQGSNIMHRHFLHRRAYLSIECESTPQYAYGILLSKPKSIHAQRPNIGTDISVQVERFSDHLPIVRQRKRCESMHPIPK